MSCKKHGGIMDKKVMIVDDAMFMRRVIRKNLEEIGCSDVIEAENGEEAMKLYHQEKPHLILLDITMPGMSGVEVLEEIMKEDPLQKVVMCSAVGQEMMIQKAIMAGALDFIVKPFKSDEFQKIVKNSLEYER